MKLSLTAQYRPGESATSAFSRQADRNMCLSARHHGRDLDLPFQDIINGEPEAIARLEQFAGMPAGALAPSTLTQEQGRTFVLNGQRLTASSLQRSSLNACPHCLMEDMRNGPYEPALNAYGRVATEIVHLRTCRAHSVPYAVIGRPTLPNHTHDFTLILRENIDRVPILADEVSHRPASGLELYLEDRLVGRVQTAPWLNLLGFSAAAKVCEIFGIVAEFGPTQNRRPLSEDDLARAGAAGFEILRDGIQGARDFLTSLQRRPELTGAAGPQQAYGRIYQWLAFGADGPDFAPIKDMVREHIVETMPVGRGDEVLGVMVEQRRLHSLRSAALAHGVHPKTAAKYLQRSGLAPADTGGLTDNQVLMPAPTVDAFMSRLARGIQQKDIHAYLDVSRTHLLHLLSGRHLKPIVEADDLDPLFDTADLDGFVSRVTEKAETIAEPTEDQVSLSEAAKRACCGVPEVQSLLVDGQLDWVGVFRGGRGYGAILVSAAEVKARTQLPEPGGVVADVIIGDFGARQEVVKLLIETGVLPTVTAVNPKNRCPMKVVPNADYGQFKATFVSLRDLSRDTGRWSRHIQKELAEKGVHPVPEWVAAGGFIYRREHLN